MPGRNFVSGTGYRYGFNGKENDNEVKGNGNQQDYGLRIYDPRLGRFLSVDPLTKKYPELTPYQFASNRPIQGVDVDGLEFFDNGMSTDPFKPEDVKGTTLLAPDKDKVLSQELDHALGALLGVIFALPNAISYDHAAGNAKNSPVGAKFYPP